MKVLVTGGAGFIGHHLVAALLARGHQVVVADHRASRHPVQSVLADLGANLLPPPAFDGVEAIIHLAGKNIFGRWNSQSKKEILRSRVQGTRGLISSIKGLRSYPSALISGSATGFYGERGEADLDESSGPGNDFLALVCAEWEREARAADRLGLRTVQIRAAPVLGPGGLMAKTLPLFRLGLGGPLAGGNWWRSWIHIRDIVAIYIFAIENPELKGPANACAPYLVREREFAATLGSVLHRPAILPIPRFALKVVFGELGDVIVDSQKVLPRKLLEAGYQFQFPRLREAMHSLRG